MMNWSRHVNSLQVDISSHCNARCGGCIRNVEGDAVEPQLSLVHFNTDTWERIAKEDTKGWYIRELALNGNWGDPMMHPKLVEMLDVFSSYHPETSLYIHTNGSMRTEKFWGDLATVCRQFANHLVVFSMDGMEDTHNIYRRKTIHSKIVDNIKAFNAQRGRSNVTMTLFEHNKHQVKEVEQLAEDTGAVMFNLRHSHGDNLKITIADKSEPDYIIRANYDTDEYNSTFAASDEPLSALRDSHIYIKAKEQMKLDEIPQPEGDSKCPWYNDRKVQIDPFGTVWPCCHVSLYGVELDKSQGIAMIDETLYDAIKENNLRDKSLTQILSSEWYEDHISESVQNASWAQCRNTCDVCAD